MKNNLALCLAIMSAALIGPTISEISAASFSTQVVAVAGDPAPDSNGTFGGFGVPALNDAGQTAFLASFSDVDLEISGRTGIFRGEREGSPVRIVRSGQHPPDNNGVFSGFPVTSGPAINNSGQVALYAYLRQTSGGFTDDRGIFLSNIAGDTLTHVVREGQLSPDNDGVFGGNRSPAFELSNAGHVAIRHSLLNTARNEGIFLFEDSFGLNQVVREGDAYKGGTITEFRGHSFNDAGQVTVAARVGEGKGILEETIHLFRSDPGQSIFAPIASEGDALLGTDRLVQDFRIPHLNDVGQTAFTAIFSDATGVSRGIYRVGADGEEISEIVRWGQIPTDNVGTISFTLGNTINNAGQTLFISTQTGTSGGFHNTKAIYRGEGVSSDLTTVVRRGQPAPDGNGNFSVIEQPIMNDLGQVAFSAVLNETHHALGLYLYDDQLGLLQVAREGDLLLGSTITDINLSGSLVSRDEKRHGLNNAGQIAYLFKLADGRSGIAVATIISEPASVLLLFWGGGVGVLRRGLRY